MSATSWFVGAFGCSLWILYYTGAHLWAALTATAFAGLGNLSIALLATWRHTPGTSEHDRARGLRRRRPECPTFVAVTRSFVGFAQVGEVLRIEIGPA